MKTAFSLFAMLLGFFVGVAGVSLASKPSNLPVSLDPAEALATYFFSFSWVGGTLGTVLGAVLLLAYLALWFAAGGKVFQTFNNPRRD